MSPGQHKKKITLVANSTWSVYNFRLGLIRHLFIKLVLYVLIVAPRDEFAEELIKAGCSYHDISISTTVPKIPCLITSFVQIP